ncbi:hypothetical protein VKS41_004681 [Umbelopsis sp. WA50703]
MYDDDIDLIDQGFNSPKRPGRKPMPSSAAARKAQNREAQRAFRERKERHVKDMEETVKKLRADRRATLRQRDAYKSSAEQLRIQNWYLKGLILTLQLVCMQHKVVIPPHSPFLNEDALCEIAKVVPPEVIESYVKAASPSGITKGDVESPVKTEPTNSNDAIYIDEDMNPDSPYSPAPKMESTWQQQPKDTYVKHEDNNATTTDFNSASEQQPPRQINLAAIQHIKMKIAMDEFFTSTQSPTTGMQPTILQLAVTHDPRIDLVPTAYMRDRMILFQDLYDIDELVETLVQGAAFMGGDPTNKMCWLVPRELVTKYWYLASASHDLNVIGSPKAQARLAAIRSNESSMTTHISVPISPQVDMDHQSNNRREYFSSLSAMNSMSPANQNFYSHQNTYPPPR